jgi:small subunit ribosomal protein S15
MVTSEDKVKAAPKKAAKEDTGGTSVQITRLTTHIKELTGHLKKNPKDFAAQRGLLQMVGQRKRLLNYLARKDSKGYLSLKEKLGIRR